LEQARLFREAFGRDSVCSVAHCCRWTGWAEPARWMKEAGGRADNSRVHWTSPPSNPVNRLGFAFGSPLPRYFWDDAAHGNERVDFVSIPMAAYEVGYEGEKTDFETLRRAFDYAVRYHLVFNFFYHPVYIARYPACNAAIDELIRMMGELPTPPVLMGPDAAALWWEARDAAVVENAGWDSEGVFFDAECDHPGGFVVKVPTGDSPAAECHVDCEEAAFEVSPEFGQYWAFIPLAPGRHNVELAF